MVDAIGGSQRLLAYVGRLPPPEQQHQQCIVFWPIFRLSENVPKISQAVVVDPAEAIAPIFRSIRQPQNPQSGIFGSFG